MQAIHVDNLRPGLVLGRPLFDALGKVLLNRGVQLTDAYITSLRAKRFEYVYIRDSESDVEVEPEEDLSPATRAKAVASLRESFASIEKEVETLKAESVEAVTEACASVSVRALTGERGPLANMMALISSIIDEVLDRENLAGLSTIRSTDARLYDHAISVCVVGLMIGRVLGLRDLGPALSPFNAFLILTGIETLALRMQRHSENAQKVAEFLAAHPKVEWVSYPGLANDRYHALAQTYLPKGAGAVFTFGLKGGYEAGVALVSSVELFSHLANIGDTRSLIIHPASTTHRQLSDEAKTAAGAGPEVVRLSIGIEDAADIIADLEQALAKA